MKNKLATAKNFVSTHKTAIALGSLATLAIVAQHNGIKSLNEFLKEHDLYDTYYYAMLEDEI